MTPAGEIVPYPDEKAALLQRSASCRLQRGSFYHEKTGQAEEEEQSFRQMRRLQ